MGRNTADWPISSRTARAQLPIRAGAANKPFWHGINSTIALGYQRDTGGGAGRWHARKSLGDGKYALRLIGVADDRPGEGIDYDAAEAKARVAFEQEAERVGAITVSEACAAYLATLDSDHVKDYERTIKLHVEKYLGRHPVGMVDKGKFELYRKALVERLERAKRERIVEGSAKKDSDEEIERKARDTANRAMKILRAALNHAFGNTSNKILTDKPWRTGLKDYRGVGRARTEHYDEQQVSTLIASASSEDFEKLLRGGWFTGARYGELRRTRVRHFDPVAGQVSVPEGKTGFRPIQLTTHAIEFFKTMCAGRAKDEFIFTRPNGKAWGKSSQQRPMKRSLAAADMSDEGCFYTLRHSYISRAIEAGVPLTIIAENCGTSVRMIEENYAKALAQQKRKHLEQFGPRVIEREPAAQSRA